MDSSGRVGHALGLLLVESGQPVSRMRLLASGIPFYRASMEQVEDSRT